MTRFPVSTFSDERDKFPGRGDVTWDELVGALSVPRACPCALADCARSGGKTPDGDVIEPCPHKYGAAWSPAAWPPGHTRKVWNVESVSVLVADLDHVKPADIGANLAKIAPYRFALHGSHSDRPEDRCLRILLALSRPVPGPDWPRFWTQVIAMLGLPADTSCRDGSRLYFRTSRPHDAMHPSPHGDGFTFHAQDGAVLDVDAILAAAPVVEPVEFEDYEVPPFAGLPPMDKVRVAIDALKDAWPDPGQNRHEAHLALAGALARAGWPAETIADFAATVANAHIAGSGDYRKRLSAARSSVEKVQIGAPVKGWPILESILSAAGNDGPAAVTAACEALGLRKGPTLAEGEAFAEFAKSLELSPASVAGSMAGAMTSGSSTYPTAPAPPIASPAGAPSPARVILETQIKAAQRTLAARKDADSLRDAEYLRRIERGQFLTDDPSEDPVLALCFGALALARVVPEGTTAQQMIHLLVPSAGVHAYRLPEMVEAAAEKARVMPPIYTHRAALSSTPGELPLNEFKLKKTGDNQGQPDAALAHNYDVALMRLGVRFRYNAFAACEVIERNGTSERVEDHHIKALAFEIEQTFAFYPPEAKWRAYCDTTARKDTFHPILDYLASVPPDAVPGSAPDLTETWLIRFGGAPDTPFVRAISRIVLVAAVRRVRQPGCKFDEMLILESPQGKSKSTALRALVPNDAWFTDDFRLDASESRKMMEMTGGHWIIEAGELRGMSAGDHNVLKQYLSRQEDKARLSYGHKTTHIKRQFIIIGSTNDEQYLKDPSGNRRTWPVRVVEFDVPALLAVRDQLWAEAARLDLEHPEAEYIRLPKELYDDATEEQRKRTVDDPYRIMLAEAFGGAARGIRGRIPVRAIWKLVGFHEERLPNSIDQNRISITMGQLGFSREDYASQNGTSTLMYVRGTEEEREIDLDVVGTPGAYKVRVIVQRELRPASDVPPQPAETREAHEREAN